jgi:hypothetical protein
MSNVDTVRASMDAYHSQDLEAATCLLADDHIDRSAYLERCFPTADRFAASEIVAMVAAGEDSVFLLYEYELRTGERFRNTEYITVRHGQLVETQVFFGGRV